MNKSDEELSNVKIAKWEQQIQDLRALQDLIVMNASHDEKGDGMSTGRPPSTYLDLDPSKPLNNNENLPKIEEQSNPGPSTTGGPSSGSSSNPKPVSNPMPLGPHSQLVGTKNGPQKNERQPSSGDTALVQGQGQLSSALASEALGSKLREFFESSTSSPTGDLGRINECIQVGLSTSDWLARLEQLLVHFFLIIFDASSDFSKIMIEVFPPEASEQIEEIFRLLLETDPEIYEKLGHLILMAENFMVFWRGETEQRRSALEFIRLYMSGSKHPGYYDLPVQTRLRKLGAFISQLQSMSSGFEADENALQVQPHRQHVPPTSNVNKAGWLRRPSPRVIPASHYARAVANILCARPCSRPITAPDIYADTPTKQLVPSELHTDKEIGKLADYKYGSRYEKRDLFPGSQNVTFAYALTETKMDKDGGGGAKGKGAAAKGGSKRGRSESKKSKSRSKGSKGKKGKKSKSKKSKSRSKSKKSKSKSKSKKGKKAKKSKSKSKKKKKSKKGKKGKTKGSRSKSIKSKLQLSGHPGPYYDKYGRLIEDPNYQGELYDKDGNLLRGDKRKKYYDENGKRIKDLDKYTGALYDKKGRLIRGIPTPQGPGFGEFYDKDGNLITDPAYTGELYDKDGRLLRGAKGNTYYDKDGKLIKDLSSYTGDYYDKDGNLIRGTPAGQAKKYFDKDGNPIGDPSNYKGDLYDKDGRLVRVRPGQELYDKYGNLITDPYFTGDLYDKDGKLISPGIKGRGKGGLSEAQQRAVDRLSKPKNPWLVSDERCALKHEVQVPVKPIPLVGPGQKAEGQRIEQSEELFPLSVWDQQKVTCVPNALDSIAAKVQGGRYDRASGDPLDEDRVECKVRGTDVEYNSWELATEIIKKPGRGFTIPPPKIIMQYVRKQLPRSGGGHRFDWPKGMPNSVRYYPNGSIFCASFPDGSGQVFYPHGGLAVSVAAPNPMSHVVVIRDPYDKFYFLDKAILAQLDSVGIGTVFNNEGIISLQYNNNGGFRLSDKNSQRWSWNKGGQRIILKLNRYMSLRIMGLSQIHLVFNGNKRGLRFNVGQGHIVNTIHGAPLDQVIRPGTAYCDKFDYTRARFSTPVLGSIEVNGRPKTRGLMSRGMTPGGDGLDYTSFDQFENCPMAEPITDTSSFCPDPNHFQCLILDPIVLTEQNFCQFDSSEL